MTLNEKYKACMAISELKGRIDSLTAVRNGINKVIQDCEDDLIRLSKTVKEAEAEDELPVV